MHHTVLFFLKKSFAKNIQGIINSILKKYRDGLTHFTLIPKLKHAGAKCLSVFRASLPACLRACLRLSDRNGSSSSVQRPADAIETKRDITFVLESLTTPSHTSQRATIHHRPTPNAPPPPARGVVGGGGAMRQERRLYSLLGLLLLLAVVYLTWFPTTHDGGGGGGGGWVKLPVPWLQPRMPFAARRGTHFVDADTGSPLYVNGWNSYWLLPSRSPALAAEMLRRGRRMGLSVCRTWAFSDGGPGALQISPGRFSEAVFQVRDPPSPPRVLKSAQFTIMLPANCGVLS